MTLELVKLEEGLMTGAVVYHQYIKKTEREIDVMNAKFKIVRKQKREEEKKAKEKEERRQVRKDEERKKRKAGIKKAKEKSDNAGKDDDKDEKSEDEKESDNDKESEVKISGHKRMKGVVEFNKGKGKRKFKHFKEDDK